jgi:DNA-binding response OmpR family regulator
MSGEQVCRIVRKKSSMPIIMVTAKVQENDKVTGLAIGADDYVTKPFSPRELVGRVKAVLRRFRNDGSTLADTISFNNGDLEIDYAKYEVSKKGEKVNLTPNEYKILAVLSKNHGKVFSRLDLVDTAFGYDYEGYERSIDTHIKNLRHKIEDDPKNPCYIITTYGIGYKFGGI